GEKPVREAGDGRYQLVDTGAGNSRYGKQRMKRRRAVEFGPELTKACRVEQIDLFEDGPVLHAGRRILMARRHEGRSGHAGVDDPEREIGLRNDGASAANALLLDRIDAIAHARGVAQSDGKAAEVA